MVPEAEMDRGRVCCAVLCCGSRIHKTADAFNVKTRQEGSVPSMILFGKRNSGAED